MNEPTASPASIAPARHASAAIVLHWLLAALLVNQMTRWVKAEKPTFLRAFGLVLVLCLLGVPFVGLSGQIPANEPLPLLWMSLGLFMTQAVLDWFVIRWFVGTTFGKAILVWLGLMVGGAISLGLMFFVMKPYVFEAFVVPSNNMSPTIKGWHEVGTCPHCKGTLTIPATSPGDEMNRHSDQIGICDDCSKTSVDFVPPASIRLMSPDRIVSNKLLTPRRWDIIIYRTPKDPNVKYLMRLVGLPGERVVIKKGGVWIDDVREIPPEEIGFLEFSAVDMDDRPTPFASEGDSLELSATECFVLGDFPQRSADSRYDGPVPWENIEGVAVLRYFPLARWRL